MKRKKGKIRFTRLLIMLLPVLSPFSGFSQSGLGFLDFPADSRSASLSGADVTLADTVSGMEQNPALLLNINKNSVSLSHYSLMDLYNESAGYARRLKPGVAALCGRFMFTTSVRKTDIYGNDLGEMKVNALMVKAGFAKNFLNKKSGAGIGLKFSRSVLDEYNAGTLSLDLGALYVPEKTAGRLRFGFSCENLGLPLKYRDESAALPLLFRLGSSYRVLDMPDHKVSVMAALRFGINDIMTVPAAAEYNLFHLIFARISYLIAEDNIRGLSFGLGVLFRGISFDCALIPAAGVEMYSYALSLGVRW